MTSSVATKTKPKSPPLPDLSREEATKIAEEYLFDHVSSFVLPGEPELAEGFWRFPVLRTYATLEERPTIGHLTVDVVDGSPSFSKSVS